MFEIRGNTYPIRYRLRMECKAKWRKDIKCWVCPEEYADLARSIVNGTETPKTVTPAISPALEEEKKVLALETYEDMTCAKLRELVQAKKLGSSTWRVTANKEALIAALEAGIAPEEVVAPPKPIPPAGDLAESIARAVQGYLKLDGPKPINANEVFDIVQQQITACVPDIIQQVLTLVNKPTLIEFKPLDLPKIELGIQHKMFETLLKVTLTKKHDGSFLSAWLAGPSQSSKTTSCSHIAKALNLPFYPQSVNEQTTKSDLFGYMDATGKYVASTFRRAYEFGGVYLLDEVDSGNANVLTCLNAALSNGHCSFPDGIVTRHKDFHCIAGANTKGHGASRVYCGRNQIDGATVARFIFLNWDYDEELEHAIAQNDKWTDRVQALRQAAATLNMRCLITPQASISGAALLRTGFSMKEVEDMTIFNAMAPEDAKKLKEASK